MRRRSLLLVTVLNVLPVASAVHFSAEALGSTLPVEGTYQVLGSTGRIADASAPESPPATAGE